MAKFKLPAISFNEGSLLRRTLLYVTTFVVGSVAFVALASVIVVSTAKALLPSHRATQATEDTAAAEDKTAEIAPAKPTTKAPRLKRGKTSAAPTAEEPAQ